MCSNFTTAALYAITGLFWSDMDQFVEFKAKKDERSVLVMLSFFLGWLVGLVQRQNDKTTY